MTVQQIQLVQQSWEKVKPIAKEAGLLFYKKLFTIAPGIRHLFKDDITEQAVKLTSTLSYVVHKLNNLDDIISDVQKLGQRHNHYGAKPEHYAVVGQCLIETLREGLKAEWNDETEAAWVSAYTIVQSAMIKAQQNETKMTEAA